MKQAIIFLWLNLISCHLSLQSQDVHFTNYRTVSNFFNPAQTGDFSGFLKFQIAARTQYQRTYEHGLVGAEINMLSPLNKKHWIGGGVNLSYDNSGSLSLKSTGGSINAAYHWSLDKKQKTILSIGGGFDYNNMNANTDQYRSESTILGLTDPDKTAVNDLKVNVLSFNTGVHLKTAINKTNIFQAGMAIMHLNTPHYKMLGSVDGAGIGSRINIHTAYKAALSKMINLEPALYMSFSEGQQNINIQAMSEWKISEYKKWRGVLGLSHRYGESFDLVVGYVSDQMYVSANFDILSGRTSDVLNNPGALELGAYYIINRKQTIIIKPVIFCPRL